MKQVFIILMLLTATGSVGVATAQENTTVSNSTVDGIVDNATDAAQQKTDPESVDGLNLRLDEDVTLKSWEYTEDGTFRLHFEATDPTRVTIAAATQKAQGAGTFSITRERLLPGSNTVTLPVRRAGGEAGVSITSAASISEGRGLYVSTGVSGESPFNGTSPTAGWFGGFSVVSAMVLAAGWQATRRTYDEPEEYE